MSWHFSDSEFFDTDEAPAPTTIDATDFERVVEILSEQPSQTGVEENKKEKKKEKRPNNSFSITSQNRKVFRVDILDSYENKRERMDLLKQTMVNVNVRSSNAKLKEGFLLKGFKLNKFETKSLLCACNNDWCFYLCKFYILEDLINDKITLGGWSVHHRNVQIPVVKEGRKKHRKRGTRQQKKSEPHPIFFQTYQSVGPRPTGVLYQIFCIIACLQV